jgi:hypothetical protein
MKIGLGVLVLLGVVSLLFEVVGWRLTVALGGYLVADVIAGLSFEAFDRYQRRQRFEQR